MRSRCTNVSRASRRLAAMLALASGACVGTNPDWDGPVVADSGDADSTSVTSSDDVTEPASTSVGQSESDADSDSDTNADSGSDTTAVQMCVDGPAGEGACPPECMGNCDSGECVIPCMGMDCKTQIVCPPGWPCRIVCSGKDRCKQADVTCPPDHACALECMGEHACEQLALHCGDGPCTMDCRGPGNPCTQAEVACGAAEGRVTCDADQDDPPTLMYESDSACGCSTAGCGDGDG